MARIGSLFVNLALQDASFIEGLKRATRAQEKAMKDISAAAGVAKAGLATLAAAAGTVFSAQTIRNALDYAGSIGEVAEALSVTTKELQVYRFAATQVNLSQEQIEKALARATLAIGRNNAAFAELGISTRTATGQVKTAGQVLPELADALQRVESPAERARILVELFGREGQKLQPLLAGGSAGLREFAEAAERTGQVLSSEQIQNADKAADAIAKFQNQLKVGIAGIVAENAASIERLTKAIGELLPKLSAGIKATLRFAGDVDLTVARFALARDPSAEGRVRARAKIDRYNASRLADTSAFLNFRLPGSEAAASGGGGSAAAAATAAAAGGGAARARAAVSQAKRELSLQQLRMGGYGGAEGALGPSVALSEELLTKVREIKLEAVQIPPIRPIDMEAVRLADDFTRNLSEGLGQAIIYGRSIGDALVASIKAAAAQLVTSGLLKLLNGGDGGGFLASAISAVGSAFNFGGARANGGMVSPGKAYLVGERGPELLFPGMSGTIASSRQSFAGASNVRVSVEPSELFVTTVSVTAQQAGAQAAGETLRRARRGSLMGSRG